MSIGTNIINLRKDKRITQSELAEKLGVSEQSVSKWENDICCPDVTLFPVIAKYFGVSIDRIFGFHLESYEIEVQKIIDLADASMDTFKEIEIIGEGLKKYPNSDRLKIYHAFSFSMINKISKNEKERNEAVRKAINLCNEVVDTSGNQDIRDNALNMLVRIYIDTSEFEKAMLSLVKISAENYAFRIIGKAGILNSKKDIDALREHVEFSLWKCFISMDRMLEILTNNLSKIKHDGESALMFHFLHQKVLELFDDGGDDFYASHKIFECEEAAQIYMSLNNKEACLNELNRFLSFARQVKNVAKSDSFHISKRNKYFSALSEGKYNELLEEYIPDFPEKILNKYDNFFGNDKKFLNLKLEIETLYKNFKE